MPKAVFTITLDVAPDEPAFVKWATVDGSAQAFLNGRNDTAAPDYVWARGYATFAPGQTEATVEVEVVETVSGQQDLTFYLVLYDAYNCVASPEPCQCVIAYAGSSGQAQTDTIGWYLPTDETPPVEVLSPSWMLVSFSGPENTRWTDQANPLNRYADWLTERYARYYGQNGLRYMRLCSAWDATQNGLWGDLDPIALRMQRQGAFLLHRHGIGTVVSQHSNSQFALEGCVAVMGDGIFTVRAYTDIITKICRAFGDIPGVVALALNSEPAGPSLHGMTNAIWWQFGKAGLAAVRARNHQLYVLVDSAGGAATPLHWETNNAGFTDITDPADRMYLVSDIYADAYSAGVTYFMDQIIAQGDGLAYNHPIDETIGAYRMNYILPWMKQYNKKLLVCETACGSQDSYGVVGATKWKKVMDAWARSCWTLGVPLGIWCSSGDFSTVYDAGSGIYLNRYPYSLDPVGSSLRYGPYEGGPDAPPMLTFRRWFQPDISVTYAIRAVATVTGATASIDCVAAFAAPWAFTAAIDDAGAGGRIAGDSQTISFGVSSSEQVRSVTYTPPVGTAAVTLALSNDQDLPTSPVRQKLFFDIDMFATLGLSPATVVWPVRLVGGYSGPCVTLMRSDQAETRGFAFSGGGSATLGIGAAVDPRQVTKWDTGTPLVVRYHDQSGNGRDMTPWQGESAQWSEDGSAGPAASPADYPRYLAARDVPYMVPHFGGDFGAFTSADKRFNRMDMALPVDGELDYAWIMAFGATVQVGQNDYMACYNYISDAKNYIIGPGGMVRLAGPQAQARSLGLELSNLNIVEVYYSGGATLSRQTGQAAYAAAPRVTMADGTVIIADPNAARVQVTPPHGATQHYPATVWYPQDQLDFRWQDADGHDNHLRTAWAGDAVWTVTDGNGHLSCRLNGQESVSVPASGFLSDPYNGILNICWDRFYLSFTAADCIGLIGIPGAISQAQRDVLSHSLAASLATDVLE